MEFDVIQAVLCETFVSMVKLLRNSMSAFSFSFVCLTLRAFIRALNCSPCDVSVIFEKLFVLSFSSASGETCETV